MRQGPHRLTLSTTGKKLYLYLDFNLQNVFVPERLYKCLCYSFLNIWCSDIKYKLFISIAAPHRDSWWRIFLYECRSAASGFPLSLPALSNDPHAGQGWTEEPWCLLACQRNVTASSVQGQTRECSLQLSITPGAGWDTHRELSSLSFIYLFLFQPFYLSCFLISRSLPYLVAFPLSSFSFVILLSCHPCQHLSPLRRFYTYTWILSNNSSLCSFCCCTLSASVCDLIQCTAQLVQL